MNKEEASSVLERLPDDIGLNDPWNWGDNTGEWAAEVNAAIKLAVMTLKNANVVGVLELNGKSYLVSE